MKYVFAMAARARGWLALVLVAGCAHEPLTSIEPLDAAAIARLQAAGALKDGCPVPAAELARVRFRHHTRAGDARGELVVHRRVADEVAAIMRELYAIGFVIEGARPIEDFGGDDDRSTAANNTSAFNCRAKTPSFLPDGKPAPPEFSIHSYGTAIDVNPRTNPYFKPRDAAVWRAFADAHAGAPLVELLDRFCVEDPARCTVLPPDGAPFLDRARAAPGILRAGDAAVQAFTRRGWRWGGAWPANADDKVRTDTQHFEKDLPR